MRIYKQKGDAFEEVLPQLDALMWQAEDKPKVRFYEGKQGIITVLEELFDEAKKDPVFRTFSRMDIFELLPKYFPKFVERRVKKGIRQKTIVINNEAGKKFKVDNTRNSELREVRLMPEKYLYSFDETICGYKIFSFPLQNEEFAMILESKEIAVSRKKLFQFVWDSLEG